MGIAWRIGFLGYTTFCTLPEFPVIPLFDPGIGYR